MKIPKLKYWYLALSEDQYQAFEKSRQLDLTPVSIDIITGTVSGREYWNLAATATLADEFVRELFRWGGAVYVLRIPAALIDRTRLKLAPKQTAVWEYRRSLHIPHCGVERFEFDPNSAAPAPTTTVGTAEFRNTLSTTAPITTR